MIQQLQTFLNIPNYTGVSGKVNVGNKQSSENIKLKPLLQKDTVNFSGANSYVIPGYPDLKQHDVLGWEEYYCGPVSAANGILSLRSPYLQDSNLIGTLGACLETDKNGTTSNNLCNGLSTFFNLKGVNNSTLEYQGVRPVENYKTANTPDLTKIKSEIEKPGFVLLNLGVYKKTGSGQKVKYKREYGHWVNAIGYQEDTKNANNNLLIINDPYKKSQGAVNLKAEKVSNGILIHNKDDNEKILTNQAQGLYEITGIPYLEKNQVALLEGAVFLNAR